MNLTEKEKDIIKLYRSCDERGKYNILNLAICESRNAREHKILNFKGKLVDSLKK